MAHNHVIKSQHRPASERSVSQRRIPDTADGFLCHCAEGRFVDALDTFLPGDDGRLIFAAPDCRRQPALGNLGVSFRDETQLNSIVRGVGAASARFGFRNVLKFWYFFTASVAS